ncbi:MAG: aminopeptidase P family N-terminal domain-containing protein [Burkholderiales bacterium]
MQIQESTLLTGPYDWDERMLPQSEFDARLLRVREQMAQAGVNVLIVHGDPGHYNAMAYLTNFTPKNGTGIALVPQEGPLRILSSGTPKMMDAAKRLTWVEDVRPLGNAPKTVAEFVKDGDVLATWNFGTLPQAIHAGIAKAMAPRALPSLDAVLDAARRRKSPRELDLIRGAARHLTIASDVFTASVRAGKGVRSAALAAERAAIAAGAQDARVMANLSPGGVPLPLDAVSDERMLDPANAGIAVQNFGYWASGYLTITGKPGAAHARAQDALAAALAAARGGAQLPEGVVANAIGLSLDEGPGVPLEAGVVYALTSSATEGGQTAYASALVAVREGGCEELWRQTA